MTLSEMIFELDFDEPTNNDLEVSEIDIDALINNVRILKNSPKRTTTFIWGDKSVTVVRATDEEVLSDYHAFTAAFAKRIIGSNSKISKLADRAVEMEKSPKKLKKESKKIKKVKTKKAEK